MVESKVISHGKNANICFFWGEKNPCSVSKLICSSCQIFQKQQQHLHSWRYSDAEDEQNVSIWQKKSSNSVYFHFIFLHPLHFSVFLKWPLLLSFRYTSSLSEINALQQVITLVVYKLGCLSSEIGRWKLGGLDKSFALCIIFILCICMCTYMVPNGCNAIYLCICR